MLGPLFFGNFSNITTACGLDNSANPAIWHCGIPITPANIDRSIAAGGFGGTVIDPYLGSSIGPER